MNIDKDDNTPLKLSLTIMIKRTKVIAVWKWETWIT